MMPRYCTRTISEYEFKKPALAQLVIFGEAEKWFTLNRYLSIKQTPSQSWQFASFDRVKFKEGIKDMQDLLFLGG